MVHSSKFPAAQFHMYKPYGHTLTFLTCKVWLTMTHTLQDCKTPKEFIFKTMLIKYVS